LGRFEDKISKYLKKNSKEFLIRLRQYGKETATKNAQESEVLKILQNIDARETLYDDEKFEVPGFRTSKFDLYYKSEKADKLKFIIELKGDDNVGFRGLAQAAYYNACVKDGHSFVLLLGKSKGLDFDPFKTKCLKQAAYASVLFINYSDIGLEISEKRNIVLFHKQ
jgi:hypothetical protein